jgi:probable addiction module antidote protein
MAINKRKGSDFDVYLHESLRESDELVFLHIKDALEDPDVGEANDYQYLIKAIADVAEARGKSDFVAKSGITRQGLYKILSGKCIPSIQNIMALLSVIGLRFSVERIGAVISEDAPATILDVAQYASSLLPRKATYMKLQKIVYYSQAESLVHHGKPLFKEKIEAWAAGPVVRELYEKHRGLKYLNGADLGNAENLTAEQKASIRFAVEKYGNIDGDTLSHLTHIEQPWKGARNGLPDGAHSSNPITVESIREYYSQIPDYLELDESEK